MDQDGIGCSERWGRLRFSIVGSLLASPPEAGKLKEALGELAQRRYRHPTTGQFVQFGVSTIERWYYAARRAEDPLAGLGRRVRSDAGAPKVMSAALLRALEAQYREHPAWSYQLHADNLVALVAEHPELGPAASYSTVRRRMETRGWWKKRRARRKKGTAGEALAAERLEKREVRSYEASHVLALGHLDYHHSSLRVVDAHGAWHTPKAMCILDDRSRLCCHMQWYYDETAESLIHALCQAFAKRGLPRALMTDNGAAMTAQETTGGLLRLGILHETTLPYSPYQNAKQECFWGRVEGRLMSMIEGVSPLTLDFLNRATQAWVEVEYNRSYHEELGTTPLARYLEGPDVSRPCPGSEALRLAFTVAECRIQRRSDGTFTVGGVRFEVPSHLRTLHTLHVRYQSWDKTVVYLVDGRTGSLLARAHPLDKSRNADGLRRTLSPIGDDPPAPRPVDTNPIPPLMRKLLAEYAATGLPPAYLPKDENAPAPATDTDDTNRPGGPNPGEDKEV